MIRRFWLFFTLMSLVVNAFATSTGSRVKFQHEPITEFPDGAYLGEGSFITSEGARGTFSSYATLDDEQWNLFYVKDGKLASYQAFFEFFEGGFFDADVVYYNNDNGDGISFYGNGFCGSTQCTLTVDLGDRIFLETVTFSEGKIHRFGSIQKIEDGSAVSWEENMVKLPTDLVLGYEPEAKIRTIVSAPVPVSAP